MSMTPVTFLYAYAIAAGLAAAGLMGSVWTLATGERPCLQLLLEPSILAPLRALAVVVHAPLAMLYNGAGKLLVSPIMGVLLMMGGLGWSFLQGVFILTQIFGLE
jgi:hypothetical protein